MTNLKKFTGIAICLFILGGCATTQKSGERAINNTANGDEAERTMVLRSLYQQGREYQQQHDYAKAIAKYEQVLEKAPDYVEAHNGLGVVYSLQGEHALALQHLQKAVHLAPMATHLHNNLGYAYLLHGQYAEASQLFERALRLDPENQYARRNMIKIHEILECSSQQTCEQ